MPTLSARRPSRFAPVRLRSVFIGLSMLSLAACAQEEPPQPPPPEVEVVTVKTSTVPNRIELPGRVQAVRTAEVRARVDGIVQRRLYREGSDVRAGQPLFAIDPQELQANLSGVEAALERARSNAANAQQDVTRYQSLIADQAISKQEYDASVARLRAAQADVAQSTAEVERARLSLSYTTVNAPISGRAGRAQVTEGALVSASGGTLLTTIEQVDPIFVNFSQSSADLLNIRRGITSGAMAVSALEGVAVVLTLDDGTTYESVGKLNFLDLAIDEATGTVALRSEFPNPDTKLLPGQFVRATIQAGVLPNSIVVPQRAVRLSVQGGSVMVVNAENMVESRPVRLGDLIGSEWVVLSGLKPGERIIVSGLQKVQPGQPVRIAAPRQARPRPVQAR